MMEPEEQATPPQESQTIRTDFPMPPPPSEATPKEPPLFGSRAAGAGRYRPLRFHAKGGLGEVIIAQDQELKRSVALKRIQVDHADHVDSRRRFVQEAEITGRLEHPGIVPVYGLVEGDDGRPCYAMRFIEGETLTEAIRKFHASGAAFDQLPFRQLLQRFIAACNAIAYAHSKGVLHRDLKPSNIMLGPFGETLVVDWGLAKEIADWGLRSPESKETVSAPSTEVTGETGTFLNAQGPTATQQGDVMGTPGYMSPEQARGDWDRLSPASDIYALGATLYQMLTNHTTVGRGSWPELSERILAGDVPPPRSIVSGVPAALEAVCMKALAREPSARFASALELAAELERWLADEPVQCWREPLRLRARRWLKRRRTLVAGIAAALAVGVVALTVATILLTDANRKTKLAKIDSDNNAEFARGEQIRAEQNAELEKIARGEAEENLTLARQAVNDAINAIAENPQLKKADFFKTRKELLAKALPYYEKFVQKKRDDPKLEAERARAFDRLAFVRSEIGEKEQALKDYQQVQAIFESLLARSPGNADYRSELVDCWRSQAQILLDLRRSHEAEAAAREALTRAEALDREFPNQLAYQEDVTTSLVVYMQALDANGKMDESANVMARLMNQSSALVKNIRPESKSGDDVMKRAKTQGRMTEIQVLLRLGQLIEEAQKFYKDGKPINAEASREVLVRIRAFVKDSAPILEAALANAPKDPFLRNLYGMLCHQYALILSTNVPLDPAAAALQRREAIEYVEKARDFRLALARDLRSVPQHRHDYAQSLLLLGNLLRQDQLPKEAEAVYREALPVTAELVKEHGTVLPHFSLADELRNELNQLLIQQMRYADAMPLVQEHLALLRPHEAKFQPDARQLAAYRFSMGRTLNDAGLCATNLGLAPGASKYYQEGLAILDELCKSATSPQNHRWTLGTLLSNYAYLHQQLLPDLAKSEQHYRRALAIQRQILQESPADAGATINVELTCVGLCRTLVLQKKLDVAIQELQATRNFVQKLSDQYTAVRRLDHSYCRLGMELAWQHTQAGKAGPSREIYEEVRTRLERLAGLMPQEQSIRDDLAGTLVQLGYHFNTMEPRNEQKARDLMNAGVGMWRELSQKNPGDLLLFGKFVTGLTQYAGLLAMQLRHGESEKVYDEAVSVLEKKLQQNSNDYWNVQIATVRAQKASMLWEAPDRGDDAVELARRAIAVLEPIARQMQPGLDVRNSLCMSLSVRASAYSWSDRIKEALADWDRAIALATPEARPQYQFARLTTLARTGHYADAVEAAEKHAKDKSELMGTAYDLACVYANAAVSASKDARLSDKERALKAQQLSNAAIAQLRTAVSKGYRDAAHIRRDKDLDYLRGRADFQALVSGLEKKQTP